jgi:hypothetical protein
MTTKSRQSIYGASVRAAAPIHELERYMRCRDCSQVRGFAYKRSHLVALRHARFQRVIHLQRGGREKGKRMASRWAHRNVSFCEGFRMTAHRDDSACTGAVVRKPPVKERAGDGVPTVTRALWRFDRGGDGGRKTRERGRQKMACAGGSRARLSRDEDGFRGRLPC